jgi:hypothetical protein
MLNFFEINTPTGPEGYGNNRGTKTGGAGNNDLFASMLESLGNNAGGENTFSGLYSDNGGDIINNRGFVPGKPVIKSASENLKNKNINPDEMIVPVALQNQLVTYLEKQGFALKDINQVISSSKNQNGLIEIGKLIQGLSAINNENTGVVNLASFKQGFSDYLNEQGIDIKNFGSFLAGIKHDLSTSGQKDASFIEPSGIPGTEEVLFRLGLGAGDVKKVIENSLNGKGELETNKLATGLNKLFPKPVSESELISLLTENNISVTKRLFTKKGVDNIATGSADNPMDIIQKELKKNIEELLKEKGVSEDKISFTMTNLDSALVRFNMDQQANGSTAGIRKNLNKSAGDKENISITSESSAKQDILTMLKENGVSADKISSVAQKLDSAFTVSAMNQQVKDGIATAINTTSIIGEDKRVISGMLGENHGKDISSFLKNRGVPEKDVKNILDSFRVNYKNTDPNQNDGYLKSALLDNSVSGSSKNDQSSYENQGNLKLNFTELLKTTGKRSDTEFNKKSSEGSDHSGTTFKETLTGKDKGGFTIKETGDQTSINILNENSIRNINKTGQTDSGVYIPQPLPKIVEKMLIMFRAGEYQSRLQITPPELGRLDIDLTIKNGHVQANLSAENSAVKEIIEANLNQLKQQLSSQGLTIDKFNVMISPDNGERRESNTWAQEKDNKGSGRNTGYRQGNNREIIAASPVTRVMTGDNQIDVHV